MKALIVSCLEDSPNNEDIGSLSMQLDSFNKNALSYAPWSAVDHKVQVHFSMAYSSSNIFLKFYVEEETIRAVNIATNSPVWEDSCVEFFISFGDESYYNLEFNCIGTACVGYGNSRDNRVAVDEIAIAAIKTRSSIVRNTGERNIYWELTLSIPLSTFVHTAVNDLKEMQCQGNFYKCGDLLPEPHFICWNNIQAPHPNFHLPGYFGKIIFS